MIHLLPLLASSVVAAPDRPPSFLFILGDDIGWGDFSYNNGTAKSPNIKAWTEADGTITMQDFHSGGTVCSPTRATVLTGRNHFRDCVDYVYGCSDMSECVPHFNFAPQHTYTAPMAVRDAGKGYSSWFGGKWHLGSFYNDSEKLGGITSSPISHGFDFMNATVEVAPTATTNCECQEDWRAACDFGHDGKPEHCNGGGFGPDPAAPKGCCFNYWWNDENAEHGVTNLTNASPDNDARDYVAQSLIGFIEAQAAKNAPFMAQASFHNCHIPFIATPAERESCNSSESCLAPTGGDASSGRAGGAYTSGELDFYGCLNEFDQGMGNIIATLKRLGYYDNTMIWFTTDNGPEVNCGPEGRCGGVHTIPPGTLHRPASTGPGSAGPLRGRKRDVWEGGHRVPGIISWPAMVNGPARESWNPVVTMDFMATIMEVLDLERPADQKDWAFDGVSVLPILKGESVAERGIGWMYSKPVASPENGYAFRYGKWKLAVGGVSCNAEHASFDCSQPQLYDMSVDKEENFDLSKKEPVVFAAIQRNFTIWFNSVHNSISNESKCDGGSGPPAGKFPANPPASTGCSMMAGKAMNGADLATGHVDSIEECCGACKMFTGCGAADFHAGSAMRPTWDGKAEGGTCHLKAAYEPKPGSQQQSALKLN